MTKGLQKTFFGWGLGKRAKGFIIIIVHVVKKGIGRTFSFSFPRKLETRGFGTPVEIDQQ